MTTFFGDFIRIQKIGQKASSVLVLKDIFIQLTGVRCVMWIGCAPDGQASVDVGGCFQWVGRRPGRIGHVPRQTVEKDEEKCPVGQVGKGHRQIRCLLLTNRSGH